MQVKCRAIKTAKVSVENATAQLRSHLKYLQYGQHPSDHEQVNTRHFFHQRAHSVPRRWVQHDLMPTQGSTVYFYHLLLLPAYDEPVSNYRQWTCALMHDLAHWFCLDLHWYAIEHRAIDHSHVHLVLHGMGKDRETGCAKPVRLRAQDVGYLEERGRAHSGYVFQHVLAETLRVLDEADLIGDEIFL
jgi:hypothetical protein